MFPKFVYKKDQSAKEGFKSEIVQSEEQLKELEGEWKDSPADFGIITHPGLEEAAEKKHEALAEQVSEEIAEEMSFKKKKKS